MPSTTSLIDQSSLMSAASSPRSIASWERTSLLEDLEDLESDQYDIHTKLLVLQRIYRTQDGLLGMSLMGQFTPGIGTDLLRGLSIR